MNTTDLIREWSMDGARRDVDVAFGAVVDINAHLSKREREDAVGPEPVGAPEPLLLKGADEDDWRPLRAASGD